MNIWDVCIWTRRQSPTLLILALILTIDLSTPKPCHFYGIPRSFPIPSLNILGSFVFTFLRASAMLKQVIDIGWMSVRLSVTRWHCIKTAEYIVMLSSPHDSPFILVLCVLRSSRNSDGVTPCGGAKYRWGITFRDFLPISRYISQTIQDIAMVAMEGE